MYWQLAWQSLAMARTVFLTSSALVCVSVMCVVGAEQSFERLANIVEIMADGGVEHTNHVDISRCPSCVHIRRQSPLLQHLVEEQRHAGVRVFNSTAGGQRRHEEIAVHCLSAIDAPRGVTWTKGHPATDWWNAIDEAVVAVGADLVPLVRGGEIRTSAGVWKVGGQTRLRPVLSSAATQNRAILVPNRAPFSRVCARGRPVWSVSAHDSAQLRKDTERAVDELRMATGMRPEEFPPWRVQRTDRFAAVVRQLVKRFGAWVRLLPIAIALLCGAGIFSVQTLQSEQRLAEFGVRRAVGASRAALLGQLVVEAIATGSAGIAAACLLLYATGLLDAPIAYAFGSVALAVAVALPLMVVGILVPGIGALRTTAIASLEGRGT
jgi:hypothetical protein